MKKLTTLLLILLTFSGCAAYVAGIDADAAMVVAANANMKNVQALAAARIREHDKSLEQIEAIFKLELAKVTNGTGALDKYAKYQVAKQRAEAAKVAASDKIQAVLNTASWVQTIATRRLGLRASWRALVGRFVPLSDLRVLAEAGIREYMAELNKGIEP